MPGQSKLYPQDALVVKELLKDFGISDCEPAVLMQILEFGQRYILSVLEDARSCSEHAQKRNIDHEDLKLAVMMQLEGKFTTPPPRDLMLDVARPTNNVPLPYMEEAAGLVLPPKKNSILSCSYKSWKKKSPQPPKMLNLYGPMCRKHFVRSAQYDTNLFIGRDGRTYLRPLAPHLIAGAKVYHQQMVQRRQQQNNSMQQLPARPRVYPSQQIPPLPFPYPKYMKPIVVYIKEEPVSPIPEIENDLPPDYVEEDE